MRRILFWILVFVPMASFALAQETIKIGALLPLTGPEAVYGEAFKRAYTLAVQDINAQGGIQGKPLELILKDTQSRPQEAIKAAKELLGPSQVVAVIGGWSSDIAELVAPLAQEGGVPYLLDHPSSDRLTRLGLDWIFRLQPTAGMYPAALEGFLTQVVAPIEKRRLRVVYLFIDNPFARQVWEFGLKPFFNSHRDLFDLIMVVPYQGVALDFRGLLLQVKRSHPDLILLTSYLSDAVLLAREAEEMDVEARFFSGVDAGHGLLDFATQAGEAAQEYFVSMPWKGNLSSPKTQAWRERWRSIYGYEPGVQEAEGYAAIQILAKALEGITSWDDLQVVREDLKENLIKIDMDTVFGHVRFDNFSGYTHQNRAYGLTALYQWQGNRLFQVWPLGEAEKPYLYPREVHSQSEERRKEEGESLHHLYGPPPVY